ncbi:MAG: DNA alkylation repair protein [Thermoguttaceae bacterium]|nr:DNA alkylation repair protein [Thermoguttaceae bacterium]MBQ7110074.1 DNA alkylation repair protein [Thermoguttaceae bacterium]
MRDVRSLHLVFPSPTMTRFMQQGDNLSSLIFDPASPLEAVRRRLEALAEPDYRAFVSKLLPGVDRLLGVRVPTLRSLAQEIARNYGAEFLNAVFTATLRNSPTSCAFESYEELLVVGLVVAETPLDFDAQLDAIAAFAPFIDSWAVCDVFSSSLRVPKDRRAEFWEALDFCAASERPFEVRFAVVATLNHFLEKSCLDAVFERANKIAARRLGEYYVDMSLAWLVAEAFIRFPDATLKFLERNDFDDFTFNKSLQKIVESRRVDEETKAEIRRLKRPRRARRSAD